MNEKNNTNGKIGNDLGMYKAYMLNAIETVGWILNKNQIKVCSSSIIPMWIS